MNNPELENKCFQCKKDITKDKKSIGVGFAIDANKNIICYDCCAANDKEYMKNNNKIILYLTREEPDTISRVLSNNSIKGYVTNWPGTLKIPVRGIREGRHNIAGVRYDTWFTYAGKNWHGVQYGNMTQILHCKAVK